MRLPAATIDRRLIAVEEALERATCVTCHGSGWSTAPFTCGKPVAPLEKPGNCPICAGSGRPLVAGEETS